MADIRRDLTRTTLAILCLLLLIGGSLWVLRPFPRRAGVGRHDRGRHLADADRAGTPLPRPPRARRGGDDAGHAAAAVHPPAAGGRYHRRPRRRICDPGPASWPAAGLPQPPDWVAGLPLLGGKMHDLWAQLADAGSQALLQKVEPYAAESGRWLLSKLGNVGFMLIQFLLIVILSAVLYAGGEAAAATVKRFGQRLAGEQRREIAVVLADQAIRGVALGVCRHGAGADDARRHRPGDRRRSLRRAATDGGDADVLHRADRPRLMLFPAVAWVFWTGDTGWGVFCSCGAWWSPRWTTSCARS
jgi:hypothetical protein